jgi:hypothetical protein
VQQRVAVGRAARHRFGADDPARARAVLHDHRAAERLAELLADQARQRVSGSARGERHDDLDRLRRVRLGEAGERNQ